ncbi:MULTISPECIES: MucR family transcriptional regulator [Nitrospirillum]|uniref:MucR family transcriptional regulator n=1 Tax=Nitrospirillum amazonense TaxID=28077 RepID=A0A560K291_9PROT|nr:MULTISPECIES: MucR family transcriptional regulator [Nitrospirillum]MDG3443893.1 MucR family transcriptional regulator [Nitrospirillum amazonense]MDZ5648364.1 MucR family transcriptional regulator [Nitrospirillum sp. BR 11828]TWB23288.1 MucR family transcriptional regulator [Nitrospirillum amazonense]TWB77453.1 MucR family transcriptional regulator [Nitrospirillum amazonense]
MTQPISDSNDDLQIIALTGKIVTSYVAGNTLAPAALPDLIKQVHDTLRRLVTPEEVVATPAEPLTPAVPIRKSVTPDYIVCLEDGRKLKMLKRHLRTAYGLSPEEYRVKWGLPSDYPMVAPNYAEQRSGLAKAIGLGQRSRTEGKPSGKRRRSSSAAAE